MTDARSMRRPDRSEYYMGIALAVRSRANCVRSRVGAVMVREDRIISTGYNGTPQHMRNCDEGGCERCANRDKFPPGLGYDVCICVHAEQNSLLSAARFGIAVEGGVLYTTLRPCFNCAKELIQARVHAVFYLHDWKHPDDELWQQYRLLEQKFPGGVNQIEIEDPSADWAVGGLRAAPAS